MKTCSVSALVLVIAFWGYINRQSIFERKNTNPLTKKNLFLDSVIVVLTGKNGNNGLEFEDYFGNKLTLQAGKNKLVKPIVIKDSDWHHQTKFVIDQSLKSIEFLKDSKGFFYKDALDDKKNKELNFEVNYRKEILPALSIGWYRSKFIKPNYISNTQERVQDIGIFFAKKENYLSYYFTKNNLSKMFLSEWIDIIKYEKLSISLFLGSKYEIWPKKYLQELDKSISEFNKDEYLYLPEYRDGCVESLYLKAFLIFGNSITLGQYYGLTEKYYTGKTKEYVLLTILLQSQDKYSTIKTNQTEYEQLSTRYFNTCPITDFTNYLRKTKLPNKLSIDDGQLLNTNGQQINFATVSQQSTLNYIDFWASWCVPCRAEMPDSKKLSEKYTSKGVNFIYISIDENPAAWERAMNQLGLATKNSYLLPYFKKSTIYKEYTIATIPRYLLIDKKGNVLSADAPRPSDPMIGKLFDKLLN